MKAVRIIGDSSGGRFVTQDIEEPRPGAGEVLVRVRASALNRGELVTAAKLKPGAWQPSGIELAGTIEALGEGVTQWRVGDAVMGHGRGCHQEKSVLRARALMRKPENLSWQAAAAFPNTYVTVHDALVTNGGLQPAESVLVNAASSGIGVATIQVARALGAKQVIAVTRTVEKVQQLREIGAHHVIASSNEDVAARVQELTEGKGVDLIIDSVGAPALAENLASASILGRIVQVGRLGGTVEPIDLDLLAFKRLRLIGVTFRTRTEEERLRCVESAASQLLPLLEEGQLHPVVAARFDLADIETACKALQADQHVGKIVIDVGNA